MRIGGRRQDEETGQEIVVGTRARSVDRRRYGEGSSRAHLQHDTGDDQTENHESGERRNEVDVPADDGNEQGQQQRQDQDETVEKLGYEGLHGAEIERCQDVADEKEVDGSE